MPHRSGYHARAGIATSPRSTPEYATGDRSYGISTALELLGSLADTQGPARSPAFYVMAQFLTTKGSIARIEDVFTFARGELHLITPFVQLTDTHVRRLRDADARGVRTTLVCRYDDLKQEERRFFADLANGRVFDDPDLHAKCFINERGLVLTSLNLYAASEQNNEMGVWLDAQEDREAYERAVEEAQSIREHAREVGASSNGSHRDGHSTMQTQRPNQRGTIPRTGSASTAGRGSSTTPRGLTAATATACGRGGRTRPTRSPTATPAAPTTGGTRWRSRSATGASRKTWRRRTSHRPASWEGFHQPRSFYRTPSRQEKRKQRYEAEEGLEG